MEGNPAEQSYSTGRTHPATRTHIMKPCNRLRQEEQRNVVFVDLKVAKRRKLLEIHLKRTFQDYLCSLLQALPLHN